MSLSQGRSLSGPGHAGRSRDRSRPGVLLGPVRIRRLLVGDSLDLDISSETIDPAGYGSVTIGLWCHSEREAPAARGFSVVAPGRTRTPDPRLRGSAVRIRTRAARTPGRPLGARSRPSMRATHPRRSRRRAVRGRIRRRQAQPPREANHDGRANRRVDGGHEEDRRGRRAGAGNARRSQGMRRLYRDPFRPGWPA
jgi:hypothetical protein